MEPCARLGVALRNGNGVLQQTDAVTDGAVKDGGTEHDANPDRFSKMNFEDVKLRPRESSEDEFLPTVIAPSNLFAV